MENDGMGAKNIQNCIKQRSLDEVGRTKRRLWSWVALQCTMPRLPEKPAIRYDPTFCCCVTYSAFFLHSTASIHPHPQFLERRRHKIVVYHLRTSLVASQICPLDLVPSHPATKSTRFCTALCNPKIQDPKPPRDLPPKV